MTKKDYVIILLECGHKFRSKFTPHGSGSKFSCNAGQGCGYQLSWVSCQQGDGHVQENVPGNQNLKGKKREY